MATELAIAQAQGLGLVSYLSLLNALSLREPFLDGVKWNVSSSSPLVTA